MRSCGWYGAASGHGNLTVEFGHCSGSFRLGVGVASPPVACVSAVDVALTVAAAVTGAGTVGGVDRCRTGRCPHPPPLAVNLHRFSRMGEATAGDQREGRLRGSGFDAALCDESHLRTTGASHPVVPRRVSRGRGNRSGGGGKECADASEDRRHRHGNLQRFRFNPPPTIGGGASCVRNASGVGSPLCQDSQRLCKCESGGGIALSTCGSGMSRSETVTGQYFQ